MRRVVYSSIALLAIFGLAGCELNRAARPSVLIIAVEGLGANLISCDTEEGNGQDGGLHSYCEESVRFSHAYTPSTLSQAAMASLLTGLYPFDHNVRNNGSDFLSARYRTLGEEALAKRYHTLFVSGGPPILRKSGLSQGFEVFDDGFEVSPGLYYRPVDEVVRIAEHWIDHEIGSQPFLSVLFLADLQFPQVVTKSNDGEIREKTIQGQLDEVTEGLGNLAIWLKNRKLWNSTHIILVGLNAPSSEPRGPEPQPLSLRSSSVQVSLLIKPARREREAKSSWAIDRNVSLVDVAATIYHWLGAEAPVSSMSELQPHHLGDLLNSAEPNWDAGHLVLSESAWPDWLEGSGLRWAIRQKEFLYIHDQQPLVFNTLTDRMESLKLKANDPLWISVNSDILKLLKKSQIPPFAGMRPFWLERLNISAELWGEDNMSRKPRGDESWLKWYLRQAVAIKDWRVVKNLARQLVDPVGRFVAAREMGENMPIPRNPCLRLMLSTKGDRKGWQADCDDEKVVALHSWVTARSEDQRQQAQDRFSRLYEQSWIDQDIGRLNYLNQLRWDVDRELPDGPQLVDYILALKEFEPFARKASGFLNAKDIRF